MKVMIEPQVDERICVVNVQGDIDASTAPQLRAELEAAVGRGCVNIVIDLKRVSYADSSALSVIVWMNRILEPSQGRLVLAGAGRDVTRILELSGLVGAASTVSAAPDASDALAGLMLAEPTQPPMWTRGLEIPALSSSLAAMRAAVADMLDPLGLSEETLFDIRVAVGEALSNAIRHGSPLGDDDVVGVSVSAYPDRVVLVISDRGCGFDGIAACSGDPYAASGRGIMFMRALMDSVSFACQPNGGTEVTLVKHLGSVTQPT